MGTRSLTFVHEDDGPAIVCIYQQFDGYFEGVGDDILRFLKGTEIVNGIGGGDTSKQFNGAGDLACRLITHIKGGDEDNIGGAYIIPADSPDDGWGAEFAYHVYCTVGEEPRVVAHDLYAKHTVGGYASAIVWPSEEDYEDTDDSGLIQPGQRAALFATFAEVFGHSEDEARYAFTRLVLGMGGAEDVSWSDNKPGAITAEEASKVLDALSLLNV